MCLTNSAETDRYGMLYNRSLREPRPAINACDEHCLCPEGFNLIYRSSVYVVVYTTRMAKLDNTLHRKTQLRRSKTRA